LSENFLLAKEIDYAGGRHTFIFPLRLHACANCWTAFTLRQSLAPHLESIQAAARTYELRARSVSRHSGAVV